VKYALLPALAIAGLSVAGWSSAAVAADPILIKFNHVVAPNTPKGQASLKFKELAEKYTDGRVKVEIYPNSQLFKDKEELEALQIGAVQMAAPSTSKFAPLGVKEFEVLDLPYMFPDQAAYDRVTQGPIGQDMLAKLEAKNIKGLAFWTNGTYVVSGNKPILKPTDMRGVKNRIQGSKILQAQWKQLGALPQVMAFSEIYQALQSGVVDAMDNVWSNYYTRLPTIILCCVILAASVA
jgi:C4-dicarboxylate-binding protein DctP